MPNWWAARILSVEKSRSIANIMPDYKTGEIQTGDYVFQSATNSHYHSKTIRPIGALGYGCVCLGLASGCLNPILKTSPLNHGTNSAHGSTARSAD